MTKDEYEDFALRYKGCGNCGFAIHNRLDGTFCDREAEERNVGVIVTPYTLEDFDEEGKEK